ncbi:MAG: hypothetical protein R3E42_00285 [Burkholderiaceae bacterium]
MNAQELQRAQLAGQALRSEAPSRRVEPTVDTGLRRPHRGRPHRVFRFYNAISGAHFYTASVAERDQIRARANLRLRSCLPSQQPKRAQPRRCTAFSTTPPACTFTASAKTEKNHIQQSLPQFRLEGVAYYASKTALEGYRPLYRAYVISKGFHFYSTSATEANGVPNYRQEGVAYYVVGATATDPAPTPPWWTPPAACPIFRPIGCNRSTPPAPSRAACGGVLRPAAPALSWNATLPNNRQPAFNRHGQNEQLLRPHRQRRQQRRHPAHRGPPTTLARRGRRTSPRATPALSGVMNGWLTSTPAIATTSWGPATPRWLSSVAQPGTTYGKYWTMVLGRRVSRLGCLVGKRFALGPQDSGRWTRV